MNAEPTAALAGRAAQEDAAALEQLIERLRPLVRGIARRFSGTAPAEDLEQAGALGVIAALSGFDPARGTAFESYAAPFIVGEMAACARSAFAMSVPRSARQDVRDLEAAIERLSASASPSPSVALLADRLGWPVERVVEALRARALERPYPLEEVPDDVLGGDDRELEAAEMRIDLGPRAAQLEPRLRLVLALRFGGDLSQREIASRLGISQMHVSRLLRQALERLRE
jgi:RNA polymerase sigma-B factor